MISHKQVSETREIYLRQKIKINKIIQPALSGKSSKKIAKFLLHVFSFSAFQFTATNAKEEHRFRIIIIIITRHSWLLMNSWMYYNQFSLIEEFNNNKSYYRKINQMYRTHSTGKTIQATISSAIAKKPLPCALVRHTYAVNIKMCPHVRSFGGRYQNNCCHLLPLL